MMRILVATDGREAADGAVRVAATLATGGGAAAVDVVSIVEPYAIYGEGWAERIAYTWKELGDEGVETVRRKAREQLHRCAPGTEWPITVDVGPPAPTIVQRAAEMGATMIVMGFGKHERMDRWFGTETALHVMRMGHIPVLAVPEAVVDRPKNVLVAMDFSDFSLDAARQAAAVSAPGGTLHLAHVLWEPPADSPWMGTGDWPERKRPAVEEQLGEVKRLITEGAGQRIMVHLLTGDPATELLGLADRVGADLIATGSHGSGFLSRMVIGSVSTRLVRGAQCPVLVTPPKDVVVSRVPASTLQRTAGDPGSIAVSVS
jgi:nucleotide-binding universal stress UspA family protein